MTFFGEMWYNNIGSSPGYGIRRFPPEVKEVMAMQEYVTYDNLFFFTSIIVSLVTLCYLIFHKKK